MKGAFLLDVAEEKRRLRARAEAGPSPEGLLPEKPGGSGEPDAADTVGKPLEDYLARWHGNWRGSSSVK